MRPNYHSEGRFFLPLIHNPDISSAPLLNSFEIFPTEPPLTAIGHYRCQMLAIKIQLLVTPLK